MAREPHPQTLFHLVPTNQVAQDVLLHPDNKGYVSSSQDDLGLEVGYHVPATPRGHVITRLGRSGDLILRESKPGQALSGVHVAFEINPSTHLVRLSVRSKRISSVTFAVLAEGPNQDYDEAELGQEQITGDGVILYGINYRISIASYNFNLIWRSITQASKIDSLECLALQGYRTSLQLMKQVRSRDRPTEVDNSEMHSWHITRLASAKQATFQDITGLRVQVGSGAYGTVFKAVDSNTGHKFAVKVINLKVHPDIQWARAVLHREIKVMERLKHNHVIEYLGHQLLHTDLPEIFMPLRLGSLKDLSLDPPSDIGYEDLCFRSLGQMLRALDYLESQALIHRDVKPDNILYSIVNGEYLFQLADFGLTNHRNFARTTCGTFPYQPPELYPYDSGVIAPQTPKWDVWSLFATMVVIWLKPDDSPPLADDYGDVLKVLLSKRESIEALQLMAGLHPDRRASAAQMLVYLFDGEGLTTPRSQIPPISSCNSEVAMTEASSHQTSGKGKAPQRSAAANQLLVTTPRAPRQKSPVAPWRPDGVSKRRSARRTPRAKASARGASKV